MNTDPVRASYLTGDGALVEASFSVHYTLTDAETFFYDIDHHWDFVNLYAQAVARELIAGLPLDELLTERRAEVEERIHGGLQDAMVSQDLGIEVLAVRIVDLHPPAGAVRAFRDVSSAKEDRETAISRAREASAQLLPRSRGEAAQHVAGAEAQAFRRVQEARGQSQSFVVRAASFGAHRDVLGYLLWIETLERVLADRKKLILPPDRGVSTTRRLTLWQDGVPTLPAFPEDEP